MKKFKFSLGWQIFAALLLGLAAGLLLRGHADVAENYIRPIGAIYLNLIKYIVVPMVLISVMAGILSMQDIRKVGAIGVKAILFFFVTTLLAVTIGLVGGSLFKGTFPRLATAALDYTPQETGSFMEMLVDIFPSNIIAPLSEGNMLQILVIAVLVGISVLLVGGKSAALITRGINAANEVCMKLMELILKVSPIGVFCLFCPVVAVNGPAIVGSLGMVLLAAYVCYLVHMIVVYSLAVRTLGGLSPVRFFKGMLPAIMLGFSSASSMGTLPLNTECAVKLGGDREVASFCLPLGATINMDGTAICQGVCAIFIAACYGIDLTLAQMLTIITTATLASIGTAGVPGAGMVMLAMVLTSVGLPVDGIALVVGVDRIFDMGRTAVNITGDAACAIVVSHLERRRAARKNAKNSQ